MGRVAGGDDRYVVMVDDDDVVETAIAEYGRC
jgi:hypothetical protein